MSPFGIPFLGSMPSLPPGIGPDCAAWRKRLAQGLPLFTRRKPPRQTSTAETIQPIAKGSPIRVECPICHHPIRLSRWWAHGCERAITTTGKALGNFHALTDGAAAPEYEEGIGT